MFMVGNTPFKLQIVDPYSDELMRSNGTYTYGCTNLDTQTVYISRNLSPAMFDKVLCHELVHCLCLAYGYYIDLETEEIVADFIATYGREVFDIADRIYNEQ